MIRRRKAAVKSQTIGAPMRYFFHLRKGSEEILDHDGIEMEERELKSVDISEIADAIRAEESEFVDTTGWSIEIVDENGRYIATVTL